jgi:hypothetical protein
MSPPICPIAAPARRLSHHPRRRRERHALYIAKQPVVGIANYIANMAPLILALNEQELPGRSTSY